MNNIKFFDMALDWEDYYWIGSIKSKTFDDMPLDYVEIQVNTDGQSQDIHVNQIEAWEKFTSDLSNPGKLLSHIYDYYNKTRPIYEKSGAEWVKNMPVLKSSIELKKMIRLNSITIGEVVESEQVELGFCFSCDWDQEHGLGIVFSDSKVIEVGGADCAIL